jgi:hypothetical protein
MVNQAQNNSTYFTIVTIATILVSNGRESLLRRERFSMVNLLVLTCLDLLIFKLKILFTFVTKQSILMKRAIVLSLLLLFIHLFYVTERKCFVQNALECKAGV